MNFLTASAFLCLVSYALATGVVAPYGYGGVAHYATVPVGRAVAYGSTINHGHLGVGYAPYGYRYGLGLAAPAVAKYAVAAPAVATTHVSTVKYGLAAPVAPLPVRYGLAAAPVAAVNYGIAAAPLAHAAHVAPVAAVNYGVATAHVAPVAAVKYGVAAAPVALAPGYGLNKGYAL